MALQKITGPDSDQTLAFVVVDLDDAPAADGIVRAARKILQDGARTMARSRTYAWALLGEKISGASAGVNATGEEHSSAMATFVDAVLERVRSGELSLDAGKGVSPDDLAPLREADRRSPIRDEAREHGTLSDELLAVSTVASASAASGGLDGRRVALEGAGDALPALVAQLAGAGATIVAVSTPKGTVAKDDGLDPAALIEAHREHGEALPSAMGSEMGAEQVLSTQAEVLMCGSRLGLVDHEVAADLDTRVVVPVGPVPVTAKGLAVAARRSIVVLPDFLTTSGPLHAFRPDEAATADALLSRANDHAATLTAELLEHPEGPTLGACYRAEDFLRTWQEKLPFGRPMA